jgi:hypothetical protein
MGKDQRQIRTVLDFKKEGTKGVRKFNARSETASVAVVNRKYCHGE